VGAVIQAAGANPTLFTIARRYPSAPFQPFFPAARRAKLKARRSVLGGGWGS